MWCGSSGDESPGRWPPASVPALLTMVLIREAVVLWAPVAECLLSPNRRLEADTVVQVCILQCHNLYAARAVLRGDLPCRDFFYNQTPLTAGFALLARWERRPAPANPVAAGAVLAASAQVRLYLVAILPVAAIRVEWASPRGVSATWRR